LFATPTKSSSFPPSPGAERHTEENTMKLAKKTTPVAETKPTKKPKAVKAAEVETETEETTTEPRVSQLRQVSEEDEKVGQYAMRLIVDGKTVEETHEALLESFGEDGSRRREEKGYAYDENHYHYPSWYRGHLVKRGIITQEFEQQNRHAEGWTRGGGRKAAEETEEVAAPKKVAKKSLKVAPAVAAKKVAKKSASAAHAE
jgi:hypothetical protein